MASSDISQTPVALVYQSAALHAHLRQALGDAGASVVYESATASFDRQELDRSGATVVVVNLDPDSEEDLDAIDDLLVDDARQVIVNDGELTSKLSGWDQARWARHLVAKIFGGKDLLPQRPPGAEEVPVRGMPQHGLDSVQKPPSLASPVVSHAAEETASREISEAFSSFSVVSSLASAADSARDELEAALRDFGFASNDGATAVAVEGAAEIPAVSKPTSAPEPAISPFDSLEFALDATSDTVVGAGGDDEISSDSDSIPPAAVTPADEFDSLFSFDAEPAAVGAEDAARPVVEPLAAEALDSTLDFADSFPEPPEQDARTETPAAATSSQDESMFEFDFDFELDAASDAETDQQGPAARPDPEALVDFDQAFGRSETSAFDGGDELPTEVEPSVVAASGSGQVGAVRGAGGTGERTVDQLLAGLDLQLADFDSPEPASSDRQETSAALPDAGEQSAPEPQSAERFSTFSFELEAIEEAPTDAPERAVVEQILVGTSAKARIAASVAAAAAAVVQPEVVSTDGATLAPFDNLFDEPAAVDQPQQATATTLRRVWVLGASIGGPDAVREFLSGIPASSANLFLLAQHMGADFVDLMIGQLARASALPVSLAASGEIAAHGQVLVVPLAERLLIDSEGEVSIEALPAPSAYSPSIDQVLKDVADQFGAAAGAIIFSGMAHDAIEGAKYLASKGGVIWAQDPATCVVSSMIDGAIEAGIVKFVASPAELASRFVAEFP